MMYWHYMPDDVFVIPAVEIGYNAYVYVNVK